MARIFTEELRDLPQVNPLDWELWDRLAKLTEPYLPVHGMQPQFQATDNRGQYDAPTLQAFRAEVDEQEEPPHTVRMTLHTGHQGMHFVTVYASSRFGSGGRVQAEDEAFVNHVSTRIRELHTLAAERIPSESPSPGETFEEASLRAAEEYALEQAERPRRVNVVTDVFPARNLRERRRGKLRRFLYDPWVIGIGTTLIVAGVVALIALAR